MPKWFSAQEKTLIEQRLLEQGYKLFSTYGLKKTNVEDIAQAAGISKGAFYRFYESKEALFMDVVEQLEERVRLDILTAIERPGPTPRARLLAGFKQGMQIIQESSILKAFTGNDFDLLIRRIPAEKIQAHLVSDQAFFVEFITRCQQTGIPIQAAPHQIVGLIYPLVLAVFHQSDLAQNPFVQNIDPLLELVAAYSLGEVALQSLPTQLLNPQEGQS